MKEIFKKRFFTEFTTTQLYLIIANFLLVFFLILLSNLNILPVKNIEDFLFFSFLFLLFSLYRPGWAFLFFIGTIALENINLAPVNFGISLRSYQFSGALIFLSVLIRFIAKRLNFKLLKLKWFDIALIVLATAGFLSSLGSADKALSLKLSIILSTFIALYLLVRNYVRDLGDFKKIISFFLSSSIVIVLYGIWQNIRFMKGLESFETMPGRPNGTFAEADWYGIYLVLLVALIYTIILYLNKKNADDKSSQIFNFQFSIFNQFSISKFLIFKTFLYAFLVLVYVLLIITVSRSAWLGAAAATIIFLMVIFTNLKANYKAWEWKMTIQNKLGIIFSLLLAITIVYLFNLTNFQLFSRAESAGTGLQKITIACLSKSDFDKLPGKIRTIEELEKFGCWHINLEDIEKEIGQNNIIKEIYRNDPNVNIRKEIYQKSWEQIRKHPFLGIGWGNIGNVLGKDERGAGLNASNIFFETWLGSGILGLLAFLAVWGYILVRNILNFIRAENSEDRAFAIFVITAWFGLTIANLFNSGIMLGFLWLFMAISFINLNYDANRN